MPRFVHQKHKSFSVHHTVAKDPAEDGAAMVMYPYEVPLQYKLQEWVRAGVFRSRVGPMRDI